MNQAVAEAQANVERAREAEDFWRFMALDAIDMSHFEEMERLWQAAQADLASAWLVLHQVTQAISSPRSTHTFHSGKPPLPPAKGR